MKTRLAAVLAAALAAGAWLAACAPAGDPATPSPSPPSPARDATAATSATVPAASETVEVAALKGPTTMGLAWLLDSQDAAAPTRYELSLHGAADEITPGLVKGETMLAAIPANLAAVLYAKGAKIKVAAVNTLGVLHVVTKNEPVAAFADLAGKKVFSTGKGTTPQYVLDYLLAKNGIRAEVEYLSEAAEVAARLAASDQAIAVLPEPYVTTVLAQDPSLTPALDLTVEWDKVSETTLVTGVLVVADQYLEQNPSGLDAFLDEYRSSIEHANANPGDVAPVIADLGIVPSAEVAAAAIPRSHLAFLSGAECKAAVAAYLGVLAEANPESVGGGLPGDDFYYGA
ncbi:MAG: ABC transporter substrate-binding protein [Bifidobacteriaceae bacterium]|jgi:NitT/TauT family transport system substrate-binding protein|nr:ABC transporter substrate-binding protein [Bifidobacteriaceae bacterium]